MRIDRAGVPFIAGALLAGLLLLLVDLAAAAAAAAALAGFCVFFFRDPARRPPAQAGVVLAPADGRVVEAGPARSDVAPPGDWQQVSVFLSLLDVHVNRVPVGGTVTRVEHRRGRFLPAYRATAASDNERCETWIDHNGRRVVCRQIVGLLARRVVCRVAPGMTVSAGQRLGVMKFGSRMDLFLPAGAALRVRAGDTVRGGETVVAVLDPDPDPE